MFNPGVIVREMVEDPDNPGGPSIPNRLGVVFRIMDVTGQGTLDLFTEVEWASGGITRFHSDEQKRIVPIGHSEAIDILRSDLDPKSYSDVCGGQE